jgi:hypothetical protein
MTRERLLPHRNAVDGLPASRSAATHGGAERGVSAKERGAILLERGEIPAIGQRQHDVEIPAAQRRRAGDQLDVVGREHHRG